MNLSLISKSWTYILVVSRFVEPLWVKPLPDEAMGEESDILDLATLDIATR